MKRSWREAHWLARTPRVPYGSSAASTSCSIAGTEGQAEPRTATGRRRRPQRLRDRPVPGVRAHGSRALAGAVGALPSLRRAFGDGLLTALGGAGPIEDDGGHSLKHSSDILMHFVGRADRTDPAAQREACLSIVRQGFRFTPQPLSFGMTIGAQPAVYTTPAVCFTDI